MGLRLVKAFVADASGAVADLGTFIPIAATLVVANGLDAGTVFVGAGLLYIVAGFYFGVPVPVQPIKAAAALAIALGLPPRTIAAAGLILGLALIALGATGMSETLSRLFVKPIVRGLQLGVGLLLARAAFDLAAGAGGGATYAVALSVALLLAVLSTRVARWPIALLIVGAGLIYSLVVSGDALIVRFGLWQPRFFASSFTPSVLWSALTLLVVPQIPLTFANAVIAITDLERRYFGGRSRRMTPTAASISSGTANVVAGLFGGMPMCHGSGGLTAHYRAGARTGKMNFYIGGLLLGLGLLLAPTALSVLALIPPAILVGFLLFTSLFHSSLVADLRGYDLIVAVCAGVAGFVTSNLAIGLGVGIALFWPRELLQRAARPRTSEN